MERIFSALQDQHTKTCEGKGMRAERRDAVAKGDQT